MSHQCPGPRCARDDVSDDMLACAGHWYQVPPPIRKAVWEAWQNGAGAGTAEHTAALGAAIATMRPFRKDLPDDQDQPLGERRAAR